MPVRFNLTCHSAKKCDSLRAEKGATLETKCDILKRRSSYLPPKIEKPFVSSLIMWN